LHTFQAILEQEAGDEGDRDPNPGGDFSVVDLAEEIIENLEAGLSSFREVLAGLRQSGR